MQTKKTLTILLGATVLGLALGAALGFGPLLRYRAEGVLSMEMGTAEYKRFTELANDATTINQYIDVVSPGDLTAARRAALVKVVTSGLWQKPVPKVSKADAKEVPDVLLQTGQDRGGRIYLGVRLSYSAHEPKDATDIATWLGAYVKEAATREGIREQVAQWSADNMQYADRALERKLKFGFDIEQAQSRIAALKNIVSNYPEGGKRNSQQVVDVNKGNEKFLSPLLQLVAAESEIIDVREQTKRLDREIEQQTFAKALIADAEAQTRLAKTGSESVVKLSSVISGYSKKVKTDGEREKLLRLAADLSQINARFLSRAQFVAQPSVPTQPEGLKPLYATLLGGLFALAAAALFVWRAAIARLLTDDRSPAA